VPTPSHTSQSLAHVPQVKLTIAGTLAEFKQDKFKASVAAVVGADPSMVVIISVMEASLIVVFAFLLQDTGAIAGMTSTFQQQVLSTPAFTAAYKVESIAVQQPTPDPTSAPVPLSCGIRSICSAAGPTAVSFSAVLLMGVLGVVLPFMLNC